MHVTLATYSALSKETRYKHHTRKRALVDQNLGSRSCLRHRRHNAAAQSKMWSARAGGGLP